MERTLWAQAQLKQRHRSRNDCVCGAGEEGAHLSMQSRSCCFPPQAPQHLLLRAPGLEPTPHAREPSAGTACGPEPATLSSAHGRGKGLPGTAAASPTISDCLNTPAAGLAVALSPEVPPRATVPTGPEAHKQFVRQHCSLSGLTVCPGEGPLTGLKAFSS